MESPGPEEDYFTKLEMLKDVRQKTIQAEKMKLHLKEMMGELSNEDKTLQDYQTEIDLLIQEKMAHVEELRLIHTDINTMENLTKQAKSARQKLVDEVRKAYNEYLPLKEELNDMRSAIGVKIIEESDTLSVIPHLEDSQVAETKAAAPSESLDQSMRMNLAGGNSTCVKLSLTKPSVRPQQPAPMKSCQSCHQLIHRNAPICPLCKAKSRSRNPKKAKRKTDF